jgi:peptide/nickel transport system permease protein
MGLLQFVVKRLILLIPVLFGVTLLAFTLSHLIGDPVAAYVTLRTPEAQIQRIIIEKGLDKPIPTQYAIYIRDLIQGDWGLSRSVNDRPVTEVIKAFFPATFELTIAAFVVALVVGIPFGILSATHKDKPVDHVTRVVALSGVSIPIFWLGLLMLYVFYYYFQTIGLPYLPGGGRVSPYLSPPLVPITGFLVLDGLLQLRPDALADALSHLVMPAFVLGYYSLALITRMMRSSMLEVMRQDYITLARAKGLSERIVIYRHAMKNAMLPTVTIVGVAFGSLLTGAPITETVFAWPGLGRWAAGAILSTDFAAISGFTIVAALVYVVTNLLVDILYGFLDPRIRLG